MYSICPASKMQSVKGAVGKRGCAWRSGASTSTGLVLEVKDALKERKKNQVIRDLERRFTFFCQTPRACQADDKMTLNK